MGDLSHELRRAIEKSGLSQYALAIESGVSRSVIKRFAAGERDIGLKTASKLAAALNLELRAKRSK